jgi:hypothetical protein
MRRKLMFEFVKNNNNVRSGFKSAKKGDGMILRLLKGRGMISGLIEKKRDAIRPHLAQPQALLTVSTNI